MTDPVDNEETPEEEKDDGFDFEDDSPAPTIDDDAVLESEDTYECLSSTEVDHLEKEDQEMEHEKLCTMPKYIFSFFVKVIAFLPEGKVL